MKSVTEAEGIVEDAKTCEQNIRKIEIELNDCKLALKEKKDEYEQACYDLRRLFQEETEDLNRPLLQEEDE